jgi:hypothetical protein
MSEKRSLGTLPKKIEVSERELQKIAESMLHELEADLTPIDHFVPCSSGQIDLLCIDKDTNPVVIEFKAVEDASEEALIQSMDYASWVDRNPDTIMRFIEEKKPGLLEGKGLGDVRIIIVAPGFDARMLRAAEMVEPDILLRRYICFEHPQIGRWLHYETEYDSRSDKGTPVVPHEYKVDFHFAGNKARFRPLYDKLLERLKSELGDFVPYAKKYYLALQTTYNFAVIHVYSDRIEVGFALEGSEHSDRAKDATNWGWSWLTHSVSIRDENDIDDELIGWIKESYRIRS